VIDFEEQYNNLEQTLLEQARQVTDILMEQVRRFDMVLE
jgi:hypothetical protein